MKEMDHSILWSLVDEGKLDGVDLQVMAAVLCGHPPSPRAIARHINTTHRIVMRSLRRLKKHAAEIWGHDITGGPDKALP